MNPKFHYEFSGGMCWECSDHRSISGAEATNQDWERLCISFYRRDLTGDELPAFLHKLADTLSISWLDYNPRKHPLNSGFGQMMLEMQGIHLSEEEREAMRQPITADLLFSPIINDKSLTVPVRVRVPDTWPGAIRWCSMEDTSIADDECVTESCPSHDHEKATRTSHQDIVIHAESGICDAFMGALYDWNHGADIENVPASTIIEAAARMRQ